MKGKAKRIPNREKSKTIMEFRFCFRWEVFSVSLFAWSLVHTFAPTPWHFDLNFMPKFAISLKIHTHTLLAFSFRSRVLFSVLLLLLLLLCFHFHFNLFVWAHCWVCVVERALFFVVVVALSLWYFRSIHFFHSPKSYSFHFELVKWILLYEFNL